MFQLISESLLGLQRYDITCRRAEAATTTSVVLDGAEIDGGAFTLVDDGQVHVVTVNLPQSN